jgi:hypothetical protein
MRFRDILFPAFIVAALFVIGCGAPKPTYPREKVVEGVKQICKKEYGVDVDVKITGATLGVRIPLEGLFDTKTMQVSQEAFKKVDGVMLSVSRVTLSGDQSIQFYTVITSDKNVPGAEIVMTRYVPDLRRYVYGDISRGEFAKRMVFDVRFNPQGIIDTWLGEFTLPETKLDEFIVQESSRRISDEFRDNKQLSGKFLINSCEGKLENGIFKFQVDISRAGLPMSELIHGPAWHEGVLELCLQQITHVIYVHEFKDFDSIIIFNKFDNKSKEIDKKDINHWRKRRIKID